STATRKCSLNDSVERQVTNTSRDRHCLNVCREHPIEQPSGAGILGRGRDSPMMGSRSNLCGQFGERLFHNKTQNCPGTRSSLTYCQTANRSKRTRESCSGLSDCSEPRSRESRRLSRGSHRWGQALIALYE